LIGDPIDADATTVTRRVLSTSAVMPAEPFAAQWTGHTLAGPGGLNLPWRDVSVPLRAGGTASAWFFPADSTSAPWAVHVQGIRTSRLVTLRAVEAAQRAGFASLVITYRGAGDGAPAPASALGLTEWVDLRDAVAFARSQGAPTVTVVAWSMGAGLALELARREPHSVESLVLICPATNWREIIRHGGRQARLPRFVADAAIAFMSAPLLSRLVGLSTPIDFDALDWTRPGAVTVPTLVIHSRGDDEIPFRLSQAFAEAHPGVVTLTETRAAPHGWEPNVDPSGFSAAMDSWLIGAQN
jgi:pimeloyl-ACP methyl ester carboxylesterase